MASSGKPKSNSNLLERAAVVLRRHVHAGTDVLHGFSGGLDSVVLLYILVSLRDTLQFNLRALHVNHGLSSNAETWCDFCTAQCELLGVPLTIACVNIAENPPEGIEAAARNARYAAFKAAAPAVLTLGHHLDDQAETTLLQLLRGAGVNGAAAMPCVSVSGAMLLLRPLLDIPRDAIRMYAEEHALRWIEDESNADTGLRRNFLRHEIFPMLARHYPAYALTLSRSAAHFAEAARLLTELAEIDAIERFSSAGRLRCDRLSILPVARARNLLRHALAIAGAPIPDQRRLNELLDQLVGARPEAQIEIRYGGWAVRRFQDEMYCEPYRTDVPPDDLVENWNGNSPWRIPALGLELVFSEHAGGGLRDTAIMQNGLQLRLRTGQERFRLAENRPRRTLKNIFQEANVPPWQRQNWPLLYCGDVLACIPGIGVAEEFCAKPGERGWNISVSKPETTI